MVLTAAVALATWSAAQTIPVFDPHGDRQTGILRTESAPRGSCTQCHPTHDADPDSRLLFASNDNGLCFSTEGASPCHQAQPLNYPLRESDRIPEGAADAGYFEANTGGVRRPGVEWRGRWPGEFAYSNPQLLPDGRFVSPHAHDPDMPRRDARGEGSCLECHDAHGTPYPDLLRDAYGPTGGSGELGPPTRYRLCLRCHGADGPTGMEISGRTIEDYYDSGLNGDHAGHQIRKNPRIALSWPAHVRIGDKLACSECHGVHGSRGHDGVRPNGSLLSDQRPGWSGLDNTRKDPEQARRFCLGCHIASDGVPGTQSVAGIVLNTLSDATAHRSTSAQTCYDCHGRDYGGPTSFNVHNPADGLTLLEDPWR